LAMMVIAIAQKDLLIINVPGPSGVRGRTSDNHLIKEKLGWAPSYPLRVGMEKLYRWVERQVLSECIDNEVAEEEHIPEFN
jgi:GDP-D-mannose 3', 5'-epimerase